MANKQNNSGSQGLSKDVLASLASVENGFTQVFNLQRGKISTTPMYAESAAYFNEFKMQTQQIEADERQLKKEYGQESDILYKIMNKLGYMKGNKETKKGRIADKKHKMAKKMA